MFSLTLNLFVCLLVGSIMQKLLNQFKQNLVEGMHMYPGRSD